VRAVARGERPADDLAGICSRHGFLAVYRTSDGSLHCPACEVIARQGMTTFVDSAPHFAARKREPR
jgi:hypothetical protein